MSNETSIMQPIKLLLASILLFVFFGAELLMASPSPPPEDPKIIFSCWIPADSPIFIKLEKIYRESFAALGYRFEMVHQSMQRAIQDANSGTSDGECARDYQYLSSAPQSRLLRINVVIASANLQVHSNNPTVKIANIEELNASPLSIGYVRGTSRIDHLLTAERLLQAHALVSAEVGLKMLSAGRIDLLLIHGATAQRILRKATLPNPVYNAGTLFKQQGYAYLNLRHRNILDAFTEQLRQRVPEGGVQRE